MERLIFGLVFSLGSNLPCFVDIFSAASLSAGSELVKISAYQGLQFAVPIALISTPFLSFGIHNLLYYYPEYEQLGGCLSFQNYIQSLCYWACLALLCNGYGSSCCRNRLGKRQKGAPPYCPSGGMTGHVINLPFQGVTSLLVCMPPVADPLKLLVSLAATGGIIVCFLDRYTDKVPVLSMALSPEVLQVGQMESYSNRP